MTTKDIYDAVNTFVASDLSVTCKLGWPAFDQTAIATGAYLRYGQSDPIAGERVSSSVDRFARGFNLLVVTSNEIALMLMNDALEAMVKARTEATIGGTRYRVGYATIERADNPYEVDALRYAVQTTILVR